MGSPFAKLSDLHTGGRFFKPADYMQVAAILFEPTSIEENVRNEFKGNVSYVDQVTADVTVFKTNADLEDGKPSEVLSDARINKPGIVNRLRKLIDKQPNAVVAKVAQEQTDKGTPYVLHEVSSDVEAQVAAYYEKREAEQQAAADDAPEFD